MHLKLWKSFCISLALIGVARAISKATLDFAVVLANKVLFHFQSSNDEDGIELFVKHLKTACPESNLQIACIVSNTQVFITNT